MEDGRRKYLTVREVADYFGLSRSYVYQIVNRRDLKAHRFGNALRVSRDEVLRYERESAYHEGSGRGKGFGVGGRQA